MKKLKVYAGETPQIAIAIKLDGIQAMLNDEGKVVSRSGKPLYNIDPKLLTPGKKYEVFCHNFKITDSIVSTQGEHPNGPMRACHLFEIWPGTDDRLKLSTLDAKQAFDYAMLWGYEGIVIDKKYKWKKKETLDVKVTGIIPGKGKHAGRMGALMTTHGKVGTGFSDKEREEVWYIGEYIECDCMEITPDGKMRHGRFLRRRWDKNDTSEG